nr:MAG TPA: hypothetical protein [Caudoviricetes sp.]
MQKNERSIFSSQSFRCLGHLALLSSSDLDKKI